jgi:hypothetical protein
MPGQAPPPSVRPVGHFSLVDKFASNFLETKLAHTQMSDEFEPRGYEPERASNVKSVLVM